MMLQKWGFLYQGNVPYKPCHIINHCVLTWHVGWECTVWQQKDSDIGFDLSHCYDWYNMTCEQRNAWHMFCLQSVWWPHLGFTAMSHKLHLWWPVYVTWSFQSNSSLQRTRLFLPGWSGVGQSSHTSRKANQIYMTSAKLQKLMQWSERQDHDHQSDKTDVK